MVKLDSLEWGRCFPLGPTRLLLRQPVVAGASGASVAVQVMYPRLRPRRRRRAVPALRCAVLRLPALPALLLVLLLLAGLAVVLMMRKRRLLVRVFPLRARRVPRVRAALPALLLAVLELLIAVLVLRPGHQTHPRATALLAARR